MRGANVVMPNLTPEDGREAYEIYPDKACVSESASACKGCLSRRVSAIGRTLGLGPGGRIRPILGIKESGRSYGEGVADRR